MPKTQKNKKHFTITNGSSLHDCLGDSINKYKIFPRGMALLSEYYFVATGQLEKHVLILARTLISCYGPSLLGRLRFLGRNRRKIIDVHAFTKQKHKNTKTLIQIFLDVSLMSCEEWFFLGNKWQLLCSGDIFKTCFIIMANHLVEIFHLCSSSPANLTSVAVRMCISPPGPISPHAVLGGNMWHVA